MTLFLNESEPVKIRIGEPNECCWVTIRKGESIDLPLKVGKRLGFKIKTTEGKIGDKVVETKQIDTVNETVNDADDFFKELQSINGIGKKTAEDIASMYTKESLIGMIKSGNKIPVRDDVEIKLREVYG